MRAATGQDARAAAAAAHASPTKTSGDDAESDSEAELGADSDSGGSAGSVDGRVAPRRRSGTVVVRRERENGDDDEGGMGRESGMRRDGEVALGALLTNVVVLQEFALEVAALVEARAGLFGEVRFF